MADNKTRYISERENFCARQDSDTGNYNVYNRSTNLRVGIIDPEMNAIKFTDSQSYISPDDCIEIAKFSCYLASL